MKQGSQVKVREGGQGNAEYLPQKSLDMKKASHVRAAIL
jgi:hypothetical protein